MVTIGLPDGCQMWLYHLSYGSSSMISTIAEITQSFVCGARRHGVLRIDHSIDLRYANFENEYENAPPSGQGSVGARE